MTYGVGRFADGAREFAGIVVGDRVVEADGGVLELLEDAGPLVDADGIPMRDLTVLPPIVPGQILCAGANYKRHLEQMHYAYERRRGNDAPEDELRAASAAYVRDRAAKGTPYVFAGLSGALCGAFDDVVLFGPGRDHDWELELAVVIGRTAWRVPAARALEHVAGYTISNDISTRDVMDRPNFPMTDFVATKLRPTFFPTGPFIVPARFVPDPYVLRLSLSVNGEVMQDESVSDIIFGVERLIEYASTMVVLRPGDLLLTGSPAGNAAHHGNRWLRPGDVIESTVTGLGTQRNRCVPEDAFAVRS